MFVKLGFSEKATKFDEISVLTLLSDVKTKKEILSNLWPSQNI